MRLVPCVLGIRERVPRGHQWARAHLAGRCWINCTCQDNAGDREGGTGDSSAARPGKQPAGSTPGCCARRPPGGRFYLSKPGMAQIPSAHGTPAPLAALAGAFLGNVKTARDFLVTAVTPSWLGGGTAAVPAPVGAQLGASWRGSSCPAPHSPQHHAVPGPPPAPHLAPEVARTDSEPSDAATARSHPPCPQATTRRTSATQVPPRAQHRQEELRQPRAPRVSPPHLCSPKQGTPPAPHKASPPPHHRHPRVRGHPRQGAAPAPSPPGAVIPTQGAPSTAVTSCPVPCRADGSAEQTQTAGGVRVEPRRGAGCCTHSPPVPQAAPPPSARNRGRERGGRVAHVGPLGSSSLSLHVARDNGSL